MNLGAITQFLPLMILMPLFRSLFSGRGRGGGGIGSIMNMVLMMAVLPSILGLVQNVVPSASA